MSGSSNNTPWAWLGLLKWSLAYSDGTKPSEESMKPMSKEDIDFLEKVMKEGIIDEGERMKNILKELTDALECVKDNSSGTKAAAEEKRKELEPHEISELFLELRDIVEQIDYARAFMAMGGLAFLLGCSSSPEVSRSVRKSALGVLSTMSQNNPPVQLALLEMGHIPILVELFMKEEGEEPEDDGVREKVVQALGCSVRGHAMAENIFCRSKEGRDILLIGMGAIPHPSLPSSTSHTYSPSVPLRKRSLFLIRALITSDDADLDRVAFYRSAVDHICINVIRPDLELESEIREMGLQTLTKLLLDGVASSFVMKRKKLIESLGKQRVTHIRAIKEGSEEREFAEMELEEWEELLKAIKKANDADSSDGPGGANANGPILMLGP